MKTQNQDKATAGNLFRVKNSVTGLYYEIGKAFSADESQAGLFESQQAVVICETYQNAVIVPVKVVAIAEYAALVAVAEAASLLLVEVRHQCNARTNMKDTLATLAAIREGNALPVS